MVDWQAALKDARLFHSSGITFGLATHSKYERNYCYDAFKEAIANKPEGCLVGMDFQLSRHPVVACAGTRDPDPDRLRSRGHPDHDHRGHGQAV